MTTLQSILLVLLWCGVLGWLGYLVCLCEAEATAQAMRERKRN